MFFYCGLYGSTNFLIMLQILKNNFYSISAIFLSILGFAILRLYQTEFFYDPFIAYFKSDYHSNSYPSFHQLHFYGSLIFRYVLNSLLSLIIIYAFFKSKEVLKFVTGLFVLLGIFLFMLLLWEIHFSESKSPFFLFYVRRFLIQPIFLLLFVPALYFQKKTQA